MLLDERERLRVGEEVERVVGAGAVGAQAERHVSLARAPGRGRRRPTASFMFATGFVTTVAPRSAINSSSASSSQTPWARMVPGPKQPALVEPGGRTHAVLGDAGLHLPLRLGEVDLDGYLPLGRRLRHPAERSLGDCVGSVRGEAGTGKRAAVLGDLIDAALGVRARPLGLGLVVVVDQRRGGHRSDPRRPPRRAPPRARASTCPRTRSCPSGSSPRRRGACPSRRRRRSCAFRPARCCPPATPSTAGRRRSRETASCPRGCDR